jgi:outer membrane receptor protein involved in Fe transport
MSSSTVWKTELSVYDERESEEYNNSHSHQFFGNKPVGNLFYNSLSVQTYHNELLIRTLELNSTLDHQCSDYYGIKTGMRYQAITYEEDQRYLRTIDQTGNFDFIHNTVGNFPDTITIHQVDNPQDALDNQMHTRSWKFGGYFEHIIQLSRQLILNVGGRMDYFDLNKELTWSPRLNLAYQVADGLRIRGAWGYYYQSPNYLQVAYPVASDTNTQSQKAIHYVVGADYTVAGAPEERSFLKIKMESYYKRYVRLMSAGETSWIGKANYSRKNDATGYSKGIDLYVMYSIPGFYGWVSYSYLEAMQDIMNDSTGSFPRNTDQKHTLALVGDFDLGSQWNLALRYTYGSGYPYTPQNAQYNSTTNQWNWSSSAPNSERLPSYSCVDIRFTKSFDMFGLATSAFLDVSNLLMAKNIIMYQYYIDNNQPKKDGVNLPPIIPSVGISVRF